MKIADIILHENYEPRHKNPKPFPGLTPKFIKYLKDLRHLCRVDNGGGGACWLVAEVLESKFKWEHFSGTYLSNEGDVAMTGHVWNILPDGSILDTTADQLGEGHDIRVIPPSHPDHKRYRIEWSQDYNPGMEEYDAQWPHPHDISKWVGKYDDEVYDDMIAQKGRKWWATDNEQLQKYREMQRKIYGHTEPE